MQFPSPHLFHSAAAASMACAPTENPNLNSKLKDFDLSPRHRWASGVEFQAADIRYQRQSAAFETTQKS